MTDNFAVPGDNVGNSLEYLPVFGIYAKDDDLYSSGIGEVQFDVKEHAAKLNVATRIPKLQSVGIVTYGLVIEVNENSALIDLIPIKSGKFDFAVNGLSAILRVSDVRRGFVKDLKEEFKSGDIVKVKIVNVSKHTVNLTTDRPELGVIKTVCTRCRHDVSIVNGRLRCTNCGNNEYRKISNEYGMIR